MTVEEGTHVVVGGMSPIAGKARFARGDAVLRVGEQLIRAETWSPNGRRVRGESFSLSDFDQLVSVVGSHREQLFESWYGENTVSETILRALTAATAWLPFSPDEWEDLGPRLKDAMAASTLPAIRLAAAQRRRDL